MKQLWNCAAIVWFACWGCSTGPARVDVIVGSAAPELERFAAQELCDYLARLYGIRTHPVRQATVHAEAVFLIGSPGTNTAVLNTLGEDGFGDVTDQGLVLKTTRWQGTPALVVGGGSPRATLWAVYELVERWGVRYLTDRDVLPERKEEFQLPDLNVLMEPVFHIRAHPTIQDFACSGEAWGIADFRVLLDQLAKMKFSRVNIYPFGYQPYLHWESKGIERRSAWLWYDYNYPITPDMVGRELFGDSKKFWNPDLPEEGTYEELVAAGERQIHNLIEHAHRRGLETNSYADITQFPPEFAPLLKDAQKVRQLGQLM
ncbi:MAG: alpha-glucuronidase family glycosyl hydrolase, partial [Candidatus Aminicenantes bacterium]|nr:alpha-glucuronidase family glycosyl hydrolase [Candidatus Aminicenantes bacterium]